VALPSRTIVNLYKFPATAGQVVLVFKLSRECRVRFPLVPSLTTQSASSSFDNIYVSPLVLSLTGSVFLSYLKSALLTDQHLGFPSLRTHGFNAMILRRYTRPVDGTIPVTALLYDDEENYASQDNVGIYDG
jgi:hypothetical protein